MAFGNEFTDWSLMQSTSDQKDNVVNHIRVGNEIQKSGKRFDSMAPDVLEFDHYFLTKTFLNDGHIQRRRLIRQEVAIIRGLEMQLHVWYALRQVSPTYACKKQLLLTF